MTEEEKMKMGYDLFVDAIAEFPFKNLWDFKETISAAARKLGKDETEVSEFLEDFLKTSPDGNGC